MPTTILRENKKFSCKTNNFQPVIIKGFRCEPAKLDAINIGKYFVTIIGKSRKTQMKLKVKYVYWYDEETYKKLLNAFNSNDIDTLEQQWQKAKGFSN